MEKETSSPSHYTRILLPALLPMLKSGGAAVDVLPQGYFHALIEEIIALGAIEVFVQPDDAIIKQAVNLPRSLKSRVVVLDQDKSTFSQAQSVFHPVSEELRVWFIDPRTHRTGNKNRLVDLTVSLFTDFYGFLLAMKNSAQVVADISRMKATIKRVREQLKTPDACAHLSIIEGLLSSYEVIELTTITARPKASKELIARFQDFLSDETYRQMSSSAYYFGVPNMVMRTVHLIARYARQVCEKPGFRQVVDLGTKAIFASTKVPLPDSKAAESLLRYEYLPPFVSVGGAVEIATLKVFRETRRPLIGSM